LNIFIIFVLQNPEKALLTKLLSSPIMALLGDLTRFEAIIK